MRPFWLIGVTVLGVWLITSGIAQNLFDLIGQAAQRGFVAPAPGGSGSGGFGGWTPPGGGEPTGLYPAQPHNPNGPVNGLPQHI